MCESKDERRAGTTKEERGAAEKAEQVLQHGQAQGLGRKKEKDALAQGQGPQGQGGRKKRNENAQK